METEYLYETPLNTHKQYTFFYIIKLAVHNNILQTFLQSRLKTNFNDFNLVFVEIEGLRLRYYHCQYIYCLCVRYKLSCGVMVTLRILVPSFRVRIPATQLILYYLN